MVLDFMYYIITHVLQFNLVSVDCWVHFTGHYMYLWYVWLTRHVWPLASHTGIQ